MLLIRGRAAECTLLGSIYDSKNDSCLSDLPETSNRNRKKFKFISQRRWIF
jgi:hypothetical protein